MYVGGNFWCISWEGWTSFFAEGVNWSTTTNPWNPTLLSELTTLKVKCLRFMDWSKSNDTCVVNWNQRISKTANHYNSGNTIPCFTHNYDPGTNTHSLTWNGWYDYGVAYEWQIDLCNRVDADIWINIPMAASADFITQLANLLASQLEPERKIYIEYGNECWNTSFCTWVWSWDQAKALGIDNIDVGAYCDPWRKYTVYASVRAFERFEAVFGTNSPRLVKVIAGQAGYHWDGYDYNHMIVGDLACLDNATINPNNVTINAYALAPYVGGQSIAEMQNNLPNCVNMVMWGKNSLIGTGISLICYEGGADNYPDSGLVITRDPGQEQLYIDYFNALDPYVDGIFCQYCLYGGCWGLKEKAGDSASISPKWRGALSWVNAHY